MTVALAPYEETDIDLLYRLNTPAMTMYLGGPESDEKILVRHERCVRLAAEGVCGINKIMVDGVAAGGVNYWLDEEWYEIGWAVSPEFQGHGVAASGVRLALDEARGKHRFRYVHAFPGTENLASNGVCRTTGFTLLGEKEIEYPAGHPMHANDWVFDLDT
jgi:RimJ/RimL family protein N-acetyltransferase